MDKWIRKLSSAVIASVLALTLSSKAYAEPPEEGSDVVLPVDPPVIEDNVKVQNEILSKGADKTEKTANDQSGDKGGDSKGGDDKGGDDKGGDDKGGDDKGGDSKGGDSKGGDDKGGDDKGGDSKGDDDKGGDDKGGDSKGDDDKGDDDKGGDDKGGDDKGGDDKGGDSKGGDSKGGDSKGGDDKGGDDKGGDSKGGDSKGGDDKGGDDKGGDSKGGDSKGGDSKGGDDKGGDSKSGDSKGSDDKGGEVKIAIDDDNDLDGDLDSDDIIVSFSPSDNITGSGGWRNENNTLVLNNYIGDSITSENCDITINASGLNQIGNLNANDSGNVYFSGTGIILIDNYSNENNFILTPIGDINKVPAVFLYSPSVVGSAGEPGGAVKDYELYNKTYPGILDEQYVIPKGINLIMPSGTSIEFVCPESGSPVSDSTKVTYGQIDIPGSSLTIPEGSSLTVMEGATVNMSGKLLDKGKVGKYNEGRSGVVQTPVLNVQGKLTGAGKITGTVKDGNKGTGLVIYNNNNKTPEFDASIFKLGITELGQLRYNNTNNELLRYVNEYVKPQEGIDIKDFATDTAWEESGFSDFVFMFSSKPTVNLNNGSQQIIYAASSVCDFSKLTVFQWCIYQNVGGGGDITLTTTSATGTGKLGLANHSLILKVTDKDTYYNLSAYLDSEQIFKLDKKVTVRFDYPESSEEGQLFAVFRNEDGSLTAFPARYDTVSGELVFSGDKLGNFVVVCINYKDKLYTKEFYDFLETIESVKDLKYGL